MLLKFIRKRLKLIFIFMFIFMVLPFLFWGMITQTNRTEKKEGKHIFRNKSISKAVWNKAYFDSRTHLVINFIESNHITFEQFNMYENWLNQLLTHVDFNQIAGLQLRLEKKAKDYGITTSREEIVLWLSNFSLFQKNGQFNMEIYEGFVQGVFRSWPAQFEESAKRILTVKKLEELVLKSIFVSRKEAYEVYKKRNEKAELYYTEFSPADYINKVGSQEREELLDYYNTRKEEFREPEKIKIAYLLFDPLDIKDIEITNSEIEDYYKANPKEFKDKKGRLQKLNDVKDKIKEKFFKERQKELNDKAAISASIALAEGKMLGDMQKFAEENNWELIETDFISKNDIIPGLGWAGELKEKVWKMEPETISDLVAIDNKWIIASPALRKPSRIPALSEITAQITECVKKIKAEELAKKDAETTLARLDKNLPFVAAIKSLGLKIQKSKPLTREDPLGKTAFQKTDSNIPMISENRIFSIRRFYPVEEEKWNKEKEDFTNKYLEEKKRKFLKEWMDAL